MRAESMGERGVVAGRKDGGREQTMGVIYMRIKIRIKITIMNGSPSS